VFLFSEKGAHDLSQFRKTASKKDDLLKEMSFIGMKYFG